MSGNVEILSDRGREVLREVVETFMLSGEPVSSRRIAKNARLGLSSASIRNVMADLEEDGYLRQPHTSAGRVPTPRGYHFFIDSLMRFREPSSEDRQLIDAGLSEPLADQDALSVRASQLLSRLSSQIAIVVTPEIGSTVLERLELVPVTDTRILCICVSRGGFVDNKVFEIEKPITREELVRVSNYLTHNFAGLKLSEVRNRLIQMMNETRAQMDELLRQTVSLARQAVDLNQAPDLFVDGTEAVLGQPEVASLEQVRRLFDTFTDKARVVSLLNRCLEGHGVRVFIGDENDLTSDLGFSLIFRGYEVSGRRVGGVGVFGPARMEYARLIPLVDYLGQRLSLALEGGGDPRVGAWRPGAEEVG